MSSVVFLFCRFPDCVSLALKSPFGEWGMVVDVGVFDAAIFVAVEPSA